MIFTFLLAITGLTLSGVAIYYSVIGLTAIFAAAFWPIVVMGTTLEISKLVAASWLKAKWDYIPGFMKTYMTTAVFVLMFITSMGIFGFLSKAHIEQTSMSTEQVAQIETLNDKIARSEAKIERWSTDLGRLNKGEDVRVDNLIDREQEGLDKIYARIKSEKDGLRADAKIKIDQQQLRITQAQDRRDAEIAAAEKKFAGSFGGGADYEAAVKKAKDNEISVASRAQKEILKVNTQLDKDLDAIDAKYKKDIADIQKRIQDLRGQANNKTVDIEGKIVELEKSIEAEQKKIDDAREEKFVYEKEYRKLEAEVGPIKYIAEFIYGDTADQTLLEKAVTWVIITIIFVFDPLAVLMLLASQMTYAWYKENRNDKNNNDSGDNGGQDPTPPNEGTETDSKGQDEESIEEPPEVNTDVAPIEEPKIVPTGFEEIQEEPKYEKDDGPITIEQIEKLEASATKEEEILEDIILATKDPLDEWNEMIAAAEAEVEQEKKEEKAKREIPDTRNRIFYTEELEQPNNKKETYIVKEGDHQVTKTRDDSYKQNEEQGEKGLWQKIQDTKSE